MNGFTTLGGPHIIMLACCLAAGAVLVFLTESGGDPSKGPCPRIIKTAAVMLLVLEVFQDISLLLQGRTILYNLPLHLCGLGLFVNLYGAFSSSRLAVALREVSLVLIAPGAVFALLFPDWTYMPLLSILSLIGFAGHTLLAAIPLMMLRAGAVQPAAGHIWYSPAFLAVTVPLIYTFDVITGCNYMFLREPVDHTPLAWWAALLGEPGYLLGILLMIAAVLLVEYSAVIAAGNRRR